MVQNDNFSELLSVEIFFELIEGKLVPDCGDFSFIVNNEVREYLTVDYAFIKTINHELLIEILGSKKDFNNIFWKIFKTSCWKQHTDETFKASMFFLEYITFNGWTEFVINCLNKM